jgi:hypothetical protein
MKYNSLNEFLGTVEEVKKMTDYLYKFTYKGVKCVGIIGRMAGANGRILCEDITIRPLNATMDIGQGAGCGETLYFSYY